MVRIALARPSWVIWGAVRCPGCGAPPHAPLQTSLKSSTPYLVRHVDSNWQLARVGEQITSRRRLLDREGVPINSLSLLRRCCVVAFLGYLVYASPVLMGHYPVVGPRGLTSEWQAVSVGSTHVYGFGLVGILLGLLSAGVLLRPTESRGQARSTMPETTRETTFALACNGLTQTVCMAWQHSTPWFVLVPREQLINESGVIDALWPWSTALYWLYSVMNRDRLHKCLSTALLLLVAVTGDRTCPILAITSFVTWRFLRAHNVRWITMSICGLGLVGSVIVWKPIYVWIKSEDALSTVPTVSMDSLFAQWEPFVIHDNLEAIVRTQFRYEAHYVLFDSVAQIVGVPSRVGGESGRFNRYMQDELFPDSSFGRAYSMLGQLWSVGGRSLVALGTLVIGLLGTSLLYWSCRRRTLVASVALLASLIICAYGWRNSVENTVAIVRLLILANGVPIGLLLLRNWLSGVRRPSLQR
jgi:hypothetical protein